MSVLQATYFDGRNSIGHPVTILVARGKMKIVGREVDLELDARRVRRSLRVADTPRWFYLPGGGACVTTDNDAVDRITRTRHYEKLLHRWESRPAYAAFAAVLLVAVAWLLFDRGLPVAAEFAAGQIPVETEAELGRQTLQGLDEHLMKASTLPERRQGALRARFSAMVEAAGEETAYRIEFRSNELLGANAFALPAGIIVVTDPLVKLARRDEEILGVLAHELGHVKHRHSMRRMIEGSVTALVVAGITGDVSSAASLAAAAPTLLLQAKYSRGNEREADAFAIEMMRKNKLNPGHLAAILARMEAKAERRFGMPDFLSSHPATEERKAAALAGAKGEAGEEQAAETSDKEPVPEKHRLVELDPERRQIIALLEKRDFEALQRELLDRQEKFDRDSRASPALELAYPAFRQLPDGAEVLLGEWIGKMPTSYPAHVARGNFYLWRGLEARGGASSNQTPRESMDAMRAYLAKASADFEHSMRLTDKPYMSRLSLITIARYRGAREDSVRHYQEAVKLAPQSVALRLARMTALEPRWGGSRAEMEAFAAESTAQLKEPADAARIAARVPAYRAWELQSAKAYAKSLDLYTESVKLHPDSVTLCERSYVLSELKRHAEAFADVKTALSKARDYQYCLERAVWAAANIEDWKEIVALMSAVLEADPRSAGALRERGWARFSLAQRELAFQDYLAAARLGDSSAQLQLGRSYLNGVGVKQDKDEAAVWVRKAAAQGEPQAAKMLVEMGLAKKK